MERGSGRPCGQGHLRVSISSRKAGLGLTATAGCGADTAHRSSLPLSPASFLPLGYFTCKCIPQMAPGFSMTSLGNRKRNHCLNLGVGAEQLSENHLTRSRGSGAPGLGPELQAKEESLKAQACVPWEKRYKVLPGSSSPSTRVRKICFGTVCWLI